jgi:branched-chain amino acid transport system permease protein
MSGTSLATARPVDLPEEEVGAPVDWTKRLIFIAILAVIFVYPLFTNWRLGAFLAMFIFIILALGLNIVVGYAGLLDLGYVAFFAIGAYTNAWLTSTNSVFVERGWVPGFMQRFWVAMAISWVVAAIFGVLLGAPTLRLRGDYLAIVTLGLAEIVPNFFRNGGDLTGGPGGLSQMAVPETIPLLAGQLSFRSTDQRNWYWLILVVLVFSDGSAVPGRRFGRMSWPRPAWGSTSSKPSCSPLRSARRSRDSPGPSTPVSFRSSRPISSSSRSP